MQYDFCVPKGALYVPNAENDVIRLSQFINANLDLIDHIILTLDNHHVIDISHPNFWIDTKGEHPKPFTQIGVKDVEDKLWIPIINEYEVKTYLINLEEQGEFPHTIWPEHCIIGSKGASIADEVLKSIIIWARKGRFFEVVIKGTNPMTEHFGALRANIPIQGKAETELNIKLAETISEFENIIICGEAKSHCVANTIKQILELENFNKKLIILEDCMSNVPGFENISESIYTKAWEKSADFIKSRDCKLK